MTITMIGCPAPYREAVEAKLDARNITAAEDQPVVLVACDSAESWIVLEQHASDETTVAIAVLANLDVDAYVAAFAAGASGAVYSDTSSEITADVIHAAMRGEVLLPQGAVHAMALLAKRLKPPTGLNDSEIELLTAIAQGRTIVDLAQERFYSERTVRRHLQSLYLKLGVQNRAEAIGAASRMGITD